MKTIIVPQMWKADNGCHIADVSGRGMGVRPMIFFNDNRRVASAQEAAVLVSHILFVNIIILFQASDTLRRKNPASVHIIPTV